MNFESLKLYRREIEWICSSVLYLLDVNQHYRCKLWTVYKLIPKKGKYNIILLLCIIVNKWIFNNSGDLVG